MDADSTKTDLERRHPRLRFRSKTTSKRSPGRLALHRSVEKSALGPLGSAVRGSRLLVRRIPPTIARRGEYSFWNQIGPRYLVCRTLHILSSCITLLFSIRKSNPFSSPESRAGRNQNCRSLRRGVLLFCTKLGAGLTFIERKETCPQLSLQPDFLSRSAVLRR